MLEKFDKIINSVSSATGVDECLIKALIMTESSGKIDAETAYARGLMQVSKIALKDVNERYNLNISYNDMFDPEKNIYAGALYFKILQKYFTRKVNSKIFGTIYAIMAYNWGLGNVNKWLEIEPDNRIVFEKLNNETKQHLVDTLHHYAFCKMRSKK